MEKNKKIWLIVISLIVLVIIFLGFRSGGFRQKAQFDVDNVLFRLTIKQGESLTRDLKIINTNSKKITFKISKSVGLVSINETEFSLDSGESKSLQIEFQSQTKGPGVYLDEILISGNNKELIVPIILEIESSDVLFDSNINVAPEYAEIYIGKSLVVENKIFNLELIGLKEITVSYFIKDFKEKTIFSEQEKMVVESQTFNTKTLSIPEEIETGNYILIVLVEYSDSVGVSTYFFKIGRKRILDLDKDSVIWVIVLLLICVIFFVVYSNHQRDKMFLQLKNHHLKELKKENGRQKKEKQKIMKLPPTKRKKEFKRFKKKKKIRLRAMKRIYKTRNKVLRKLKKQKKKSQMQGKLNSWKRQGYNVNEFLIHTKQKKENIRNKADEFRKQGYGA